MTFMSNLQRKDARTRSSSSEQGFTLLETSASLVIMMVAALGAASLFAYATNANSGANDRQLAMALGQKRMEWLRNIPFSVITRNVAYSYPDGGLGATGSSGVTETETSADRIYTLVTKIEDTGIVPAGEPDAGQPTLKTITITVTSQGAGTALGTVTLWTQRSTLVPGTY